ncbi:MAG: DUF2169 domain-containing protein [Sandaracinaceae bacterium]
MTIPPQISTRLDAAIDIFDLYELDGSMSWALVIKQRFLWDDRGGIERTVSTKVNAVDVPWDDGISTKEPGDVYLRKPGVDVVVAGTAVARTPSTQIDVHVSVGDVEKSLVVFGPRVWYRGAAGIVPSPPAQLERLELMWEHAYGGLDDKDPEHALEEPRNPFGTGVAYDPASLDQLPVPQIEDPRDLIRSARTRPAPANVGALGPSFAPRRGYGGTRDQKWQDERMPLQPLDFDERFNLVAHPELVSRTIRGGEQVRLLNIGQPGPTEFKLPRTVYQVDARTDAATLAFRPVLDTVVLLPDDRYVDMVHRIAIPIRRGAQRVREILVYEKRVIGA